MKNNLKNQQAEKTHTCMNCGASLTTKEALNHKQVIICQPSETTLWCSECKKQMPVVHNHSKLSEEKQMKTIDEILEDAQYIDYGEDQFVFHCSEVKQALKQLILEKLPKGYPGQSFNGMVNINVVGVETVRQVIEDLFEGRE